MDFVMEILGSPMGTGARVIHDTCDGAHSQSYFVLGNLGHIEPANFWAIDRPASRRRGWPGLVRMSEVRHGRNDLAVDGAEGV